MKPIQPTKTDVLARRLSLMAEAGGVITKDRQRVIRESADRLRELEEAVRILTNTGGDANEIN